MLYLQVSKEGVTGVAIQPALLPIYESKTHLSLQLGLGQIGATVPRITYLITFKYNVSRLHFHCLGAVTSTGVRENTKRGDKALMNLDNQDYKNDTRSLEDHHLSALLKNCLTPVYFSMCVMGSNQIAHSS